jgi:hypothetical protein
MTPVERDELAKLTISISPMMASINDDESRGNDNGAGQAREVRNKYLNRIGVGDVGNSSDTEPLLQ